MTVTRGFGVEELAALAGGGDLDGVERRPNGFSTKAASELVTLHFRGGARRDLLVKRVSDPSEDRRPDPPDRELRVYEALDGHPAFAAPGFAGVVGGADPHLVLDAVGGHDLRYHGLDAWERAAAALGRMQASFHDDPVLLDRLDFLPRAGHGEDVEEARRALATARRVDPGAAATLAPVVERYEPVADVLAGLPRTLVHGDLSPKNVMVSTGDDGDRTVFVDWEWAHVGAGPLDLADLGNGLDDGAAARLGAAYADAAGPVVPPDPRELARALDAARLQRLMFRIGRSVAWGVGAEALRAAAGDAAALHARLSSR